MINEHVFLTLRGLFLKWLTKDSKHSDARRKDFNQAIFIDEGFGKGEQCFNGTNLDMVMEKFDRAVKEWLETYEKSSNN